MGLRSSGVRAIAVFGFVCWGCAAFGGPADTAAAPVATGSPPSTTPEQRELLVRMAKAELQPDRLKRCLDYPDPPGIHWQRATVAGLCHLEFDEYMSLKDMRAMLDHRDASGLDKHFAKLAREQQHDVTSSRLDDTLLRAFACSCKEARDAADAWLAQSPNSAWAYAASGLQYSAAAYAARGTEFIDKTPPERILRMDELHKKAVVDLDRALAIDPDLSVALAKRIAIDRIEGRTDEAHNRLVAAIRRAPESYQVQYEAATLAEPKWGGAPGELQAARRRLVDASATNPMLLFELTDLDWKAHECSDCKWDMRTYQPMLEEAPSLAVLRKAGIYEVDHQDDVAAVIYLSEVFRFSPTGEAVAHFKRGMARAHMGDFDGAQRDAETSLDAKADFQPAMMLLQMLPGMRSRAESAARQGDARHS